MKQMAGIIIEVPGDFKDVRLVLYKDPVLAQQDFTKYGDKYGIKINKITHTVVVPDNTQIGYYYFIHEPTQVNVPDNITTNVMRFSSKVAASLYDASRITDGLNVYYKLDAKWLSSAGTTDWKENPMEEVIK